ncbi:hypothetical protein MY3296_002652 [Beauveria thailandica]
MNVSVSHKSSKIPITPNHRFSSANMNTLVYIHVALVAAMTVVVDAAPVRDGPILADAGDVIVSWGKLRK